MHTKIHLAAPNTAAVARLVLKISTLVRSPRAAETNPDQTLQALEKLAELSPHLMADIGFAPLRGSDLDGYEIWSNGTLRILVAI